ncbi:restriction endonuclease subunit R [Leptolyngbyaceae cyanobacterium CCMR0082]|uniref:Restriction endonuclease subunit R n=1 Tax=Adonisia turfae CCMR0082 TaxID=2304604 RepID=A0A6M0S529_9CYAN|nr:restriction endonuclease subunit R [Adonisia turfae]NEZ63071.1 restriction endonuclease subunit R [Adonisia turfae CCMR0082]
MVQVIAAHSLELHEVEAQFGLQQSTDPAFFLEWQGVEADLDERDRYWLDKAKSNFLSLIKYRLHEEVVKMSILAPLLAVSGLGTAPFVPKAEKQIEVTFPAQDSDNEDEIIRGRIDLLVLYRNLWVVTIETKPQQSDVLEALPQVLTYMMASPEKELPLFGLLTNGRHFIFVKLLKKTTPTYCLSELFTLFRQGNEMYQVTAILQYLGKLMMAVDWKSQKVSS